MKTDFRFKILVAEIDYLCLVQKCRFVDMIRRLVTPESQNVMLQIPPQFVGKKVEIIAFTVDEAATESSLKDQPVTHFASQAVLAKDWLRPEEDKAWQDL